MLILRASSWMRNNLFSTWIIIELSVILLLGLITLDTSYSRSESIIKYFIIQIMTSLLLLICVALTVFRKTLLTTIWLIFMICVKMGVFPFQIWLVKIVGKMNWVTYLMIRRVRKIIPITICFYRLSYLSIMIISTSSVVGGSLMGINNTIIQKIIVYSSMIHVGWCFCSLIFREWAFYAYLLSYLFMITWLSVFCNKKSIFHINQISLFGFNNQKIILMLMCLNIAGFPPFIGFIIKWMVINMIVIANIKIIIAVMVISSSVATFFYLQIWFMLMIKHVVNNKWWSCAYNRPMIASLIMISHLLLFVVN